MPNESRVISQYDLEVPTEALVMRSLARYMDDDEAEATWRAACLAAQIGEAQGPYGYTPDELLRAVDHLEQQDALAATCAKGLRVRIKSYVVLAAAQMNE